MATVIVLTADFGNHDELPRVPIEQRGVDVEWLYYTDSDERAPAPWRTIGSLDAAYSSSNLCAKWFKCKPPVGERDVIWIDANMEITSSLFVTQALDCRHDGVAAWTHPRRDCIYDEAEASVGSEAQGNKYDGFDLAAQVASYRAEGYPAHGGLFACGTIAWDFDDLHAAALGGDWFTECLRWSPQDQLSFPVVCRRLGVTPGEFPYAQIDRGLSRGKPYLANPWLRIWPHRATT